MPQAPAAIRLLKTHRHHDVGLVGSDHRRFLALLSATFHERFVRRWKGVKRLPASKKTLPLPFSAMSNKSG
jgi:hypothetical protein